jgi:hypothetical protein
MKKFGRKRFATEFPGSGFGGVSFQAQIERLDFQSLIGLPFLALS